MKEEIKVLKNCWVMTTDHVLDEGNMALKLAIKNILNELERIQKENKELKKYEEYYKEQNEVNKKFIPKQVIRDKIKEIENSGIWITEDCFFDGETDNLICQQEFKKYEMEEYIINLLRKLLGDE